jgi:hypothetical protein
MDATSFNYAPLGHNEIRLVELLPCTDAAAPIDCNVKDVKLMNQPIYEALSYIWGPEVEPTFIRINGKKYRIRENLFLALQRLRLEGRSRTL